MRVIVKLQMIDNEHVKKFLAFMQSNMPVRIGYEIKNGKKYYYASAEIVNNYFVSRLISLGVGPRKTFILEFPDIREDLIRHFIRGYVDGNGSIDVLRTSLQISCASLSFMEKLREYFSFARIANIEYVKHAKCMRLSYSGRTGLKVLDWLYKDATIYLNRKYSKYLEINNGG